MSLIGAEALQRRFAAITDTHKLLGQLGLLGVREAKLLVPRRTGNLGRSIRLGPVGATSVRIVAGGSAQVGYAAAVEFGSRAHDIVPVRKKALMFSGGAPTRLTGSVTSAGRRSGKGVVFAKRVHIRARAAHPYLVPGAKRAVELSGARVLVTAWNSAA